jgi:hypothetical protein
MAAKQRPHSPEGTRLEGPDRDGVYRIIIPSESRPGKEHTLTVAYDGTPLNCTCEGNVAYLAYQMSLGTVQPNPERRPCWHWLAAADLLAHHLEPPPADPGGAALEAAQDALDTETRAWTDPPELAGLTACEDAARDERKRRYTESMANLYGN